MKCHKIFHLWDGCVCTKCGTTRHRWKEYDDVCSWGNHDDRICKRCGKIEWDYTAKPILSTNTDDSDCPDSDGCDNPSGYDGWGWPDDE